MVIKQVNSLANVHQQAKGPTADVNNWVERKYEFAAVAVATAITGAGTTSTKATKNELLYPISPFDEIPSIRNLFQQLSPNSRPLTGRRGHRTELRQERQDISAKSHRHASRQQRDRTAPPVEVSNHCLRKINDAHEVPAMIEIPSTPTYSEDSLLTSEDCLIQVKEDIHGQRPLTPHPSYEDDLNFEPTASDLRHLYRSFVKADQEISWPSDEDDISTQKDMTKRKNQKKGGRKAHHDHRVRLA